MQAEQLEILDFLRSHAPFNELPEEVLSTAAAHIDVSYFKAGTQIFSFGDQINDWHIIRSGSVEVYRRNGELYNRLSEGGFFGEFGLLRNRRVRFPVVALEDTLVYLLPLDLFEQFFEEHEVFADIVEIEDRSRLRTAVAQKEDANELMTAKVEVLIGREPICVPLTATAKEAATLMTENNVSSLLVVAEEGPEESDPDDMGIITDRDFRERLVTQGQPPETPVSEIMSRSICYVEHHQFVFEAMLMMLRFNVHHLPVFKKGKPAGVIGLSDILRYESQNSLFVVRSIFRAQNVDELETLYGQVQDSFVRMVREDANSRMIGGAMAVIGRSFKQRLLELAEEQLGPPPVPYCFLALGSMAREEQLIVTDQDNALVLDNRFDPEQHDAYFAALAKFVSDGLARCGYSYCTGGIMATNQQWRQPLKRWHEYFSDWIENPTPEKLLNANIFFDLEGVWGEKRWARQLNEFIRNKAKKSPRFLTCMARNALLRTPPLGFFKDFVMESDGRHSNSINIKRRGTAPLADLIRVHALAIGSKERNTFDRLNDVIEAGILTPGSGPDLRDSLELIAMVRIRHQVIDIEEGVEPDNNVEPENLSDFERKHLKGAFQILMNAQKFLKFKYQSVR